MFEPQQEWVVELYDCPEQSRISTGSSWIVISSVFCILYISCVDDTVVNLKVVKVVSWVVVGMNQSYDSRLLSGILNHLWTGKTNK